MHSTSAREELPLGAQVSCSSRSRTRLASLPAPNLTWLRHLSLCPGLRPPRLEPAPVTPAMQIPSTGKASGTAWCPFSTPGTRESLRCDRQCLREAHQQGRLSHCRHRCPHTAAHPKIPRAPPDRQLVLCFSDFGLAPLAVLQNFPHSCQRGKSALDTARLRGAMTKSFHFGGSLRNELPNKVRLLRSRGHWKTREEVGHPGRQPCRCRRDCLQGSHRCRNGGPPEKPNPSQIGLRPGRCLVAKPAALRSRAGRARAGSSMAWGSWRFRWGHRPRWPRRLRRPPQPLQPRRSACPTSEAASRQNQACPAATCPGLPALPMWAPKRKQRNPEALEETVDFASVQQPQ